MAAVAGFAKAIPPHGAGYSFENSGAMETRFRNVTWLQANFRVRWRWTTEAVFHDLDGTFTQHSAGCKVLYDDVISDQRAFPECWHDARYGGTVCPASLRFVTVGMTPPDPNLKLGPGFGSRLSYYGERSKGVYVDPTDTEYLLNKWRPAGSFFLVSFDVATTEVHGELVGGQKSSQPSARFGSSAEQVTILNTGRSNIGWRSAQGQWLSHNVLNVTFKYTSEFNEEDYVAFAVARIDADEGELRWVQPAAARQLRTNVPWVNCEVRPHDCTGPVRYDALPSTDGFLMNLANTAHFYGSQVQWLMVPNRRYQFEVIELSGTINHLEAFALWVGNGLEAGDFIEIEVNPYGSYQEPVAF
eukprot:scaffold90300_cov63-Phaeocystis_antarctica.AAC.1